MIWCLEVLVEYGRWLKDSIYGSTNDVVHLKETDFIRKSLGFEKRSKFTLQILQFSCLFLARTP